jgi:hypothetical protein
MRKFAIALGVTAAVGRRCGRRRDLVGNSRPSLCDQEFFAGREGGLLWPRPLVPHRLCAPMRTVEMQMRALLVDKVPAI